MELGEGEDWKRVRTYGVQVNFRRWKVGDGEWCVQVIRHSRVAFIASLYPRLPVIFA